MKLLRTRYSSSRGCAQAKRPFWWPAGFAGVPRRRVRSSGRDDPLRSTRFELALPQDVSAPRIARRTLNEWFATSLADDELDTAKLLVSELVTNALLHGQGTITLRAHLDDDRLLIEVMDEGPGFERTVRDADFEINGGLGLGLVDGESSRWGVDVGATHVWFELERSGPRLGPAKKPQLRVLR